MDGLECSEHLLSDIRNDDGWFRLDSHYYEKRYIVLKEKLSNMPHWLLRDMVSKPIQTGHTPSMTRGSFYGGNIAFIKTDNLHANYINASFAEFLSEEGNAEIARTSLQESDIITTIIGATEEIIARSAIVLAEHLPANINQNIVQIRINKQIAYPEYVNTYLNTKYGRDYFRYLSRQTEQVNLNCKEVELVPVPKFTLEFQEAIARCVIRANNLQQEANLLYTSAEQVLASRISLVTATETNVSIKSFVDSFCTTGRLDAEYYQPKYDDLFALLVGLSTEPLGKIVDMMKSIEPGSEYYGNEGIPFIRVSDISAMGIDNPAIRIPKTIVPSIANLFPKKDTILFSKDGSVGIAYKVEEDIKAVTSSALLHFRVRDSAKILPDYLTLVLNSEIVQLQAERDTSGAIIQHWKPDDIAKVIIPILPNEVQWKITQKVQSSFACRKHAEKLISIAVRAVEVAIEEDEAIAIAWLNKEMSESSEESR